MVPPERRQEDRHDVKGASRRYALASGHPGPRSDPPNDRRRHPTSRGTGRGGGPPRGAIQPSWIAPRATASRAPTGRGARGAAPGPRAPPCGAGTRLPPGTSTRPALVARTHEQRRPGHLAEDVLQGGPAGRAGGHRRLVLSDHHQVLDGASAVAAAIGDRSPPCTLLLTLEPTSSAHATTVPPARAAASSTLPSSRSSSTAAAAPGALRSRRSYCSPSMRTRSAARSACSMT